LAHLGYKVTAVGDGKDAIEEIKKSRKEGNSFDLIILDLTVPGGMSGLEAIKEIKRIAPTLKAVVTTGYSQDPVTANYKDYGFHGFLIKPFSIDKISKVVDEIINA
jgi:CheY-like chemotaxis protein